MKRTDWNILLSSGLYTRFLCVTLFLFTLCLSVSAEPEPFLQEKTWDFGEIEYETSISKEFLIENKSNDILKITRVRSSCYCLKTEIITETAAKDPPAKVKLTFTALSSLQNDVNVLSFIHTNASKSPILQIQVKGKIKSPVLSVKVARNEIVLFYLPSSADYNHINELLRKVSKKHDISVRQYPVSSENFLLLQQFEKAYQVKKHGSIEMFSCLPFKYLGSNEIEYFCKSDEITKYLENLLKDVPKPRRTENLLPVQFFYSSNCNDCFGILNETIPAIRQKYLEQIRIEIFDIGIEENYLKLLLFEKQFGVAENESIVVFIGDTAYLAGGKRIKGDIDSAIKNALISQGEIKPVAVKQDRALLVEKFNSFGISGIVIAGFLDGINPCAFTIILFLISFLSFAGKSRRQVLLASVFFIAAVFLAYFLIGAGVFGVLQKLGEYRLLSRIIYYTALVFIFGLAVLALYDIITYFRANKTKGMILQVPESFKKKIHSTLRNKLLTGSLIFGAFASGFLVSLFEAVCTGQMYVPTIIFVSRIPELKIHALLYLLLYNFMFIVPLVFVSVLFFAGVSSQRLNEFSRKNFVFVKIAIFAFFTGMGIVLAIL